MHVLLHYIYTKKKPRATINVHTTVMDRWTYTFTKISYICSVNVPWVLLPRWSDFKIYIVQRSINPDDYIYMLALREPTKEQECFKIKINQVLEEKSYS